MAEITEGFRGARWRLPFLSRSGLPSWCIPFGYCAGSVLLGWTLPRFEARFVPEWTSPMSVASAMAIYSCVATGMITLTGIVFSLVFVMLQFSFTAYSPRLVLWMSRDPLLFHAIGVFTATFLYAIAALAWVDRGTGKVPFLSVWMVVALLLSSVAVFVGLVHRLNRLHIHRVLNFTGDLGRRVIEMLYPPVEKGGAAPAASEFRRWPITQSLHYSGPPRAIQAMDIRSLAGLAENADGVIEVTSSVGDTLVESTLLLRIYGARRTVGERELRRAIRVGQERTFEQDPKYAIRLLVDIAIRALSPAVNDPSTAVQALDQIEDLLVRLGRRRLEISEIENSAGRLRLVIPVPTWEDFLNLAFDEIRFYGATSVQVSRRLRALLLDLVEAVPEERRQPVRNQLTRLEGAIRRAYPDAEDHAQASAEDREGLGAPRTRRTA